MLTATTPTTTEKQLTASQIELIVKRAELAAEILPFILDQFIDRFDANELNQIAQVRKVKDFSSLVADPAEPFREQILSLKKEALELIEYIAVSLKQVKESFLQGEHESAAIFYNADLPALYKKIFELTENLKTTYGAALSEHKDRFKSAFPSYREAIGASAINNMSLADYAEAVDQLSDSQRSARFERHFLDLKKSIDLLLTTEQAKTSWTSLNGIASFLKIATGLYLNSETNLSSQPSEVFVDSQRFSELGLLAIKLLHDEAITVTKRLTNERSIPFSSLLSPDFEQSEIFALLNDLAQSPFKLSISVNDNGQLAIICSTSRYVSHSLESAFRDNSDNLLLLNNLAATAMPGGKLKLDRIDENTLELVLHPLDRELSKGESNELNDLNSSSSQFLDEDQLEYQEDSLHSIYDEKTLIERVHINLKGFAQQEVLLSLPFAYVAFAQARKLLVDKLVQLQETGAITGEVTRVYLYKLINLNRNPNQIDIEDSINNGPEYYANRGIVDGIMTSSFVPPSVDLNAYRALYQKLEATPLWSMPKSSIAETLPAFQGLYDTTLLLIGNDSFKNPPFRKQLKELLTFVSPRHAIFYDNVTAEGMNLENGHNFSCEKFIEQLNRAIIDCGITKEMNLYLSTESRVNAYYYSQQPLLSFYLAKESGQVVYRGLYDFNKNKAYLAEFNQKVSNDLIDRWKLASLTLRERLDHSEGVRISDIGEVLDSLKLKIVPVELYATLIESLTRSEQEISEQLAACFSESGLYSIKAEDDWLIVRAVYQKD